MKLLKFLFGKHHWLQLVMRNQRSNELSKEINGFCLLLEIAEFVKAAIIRNKENTFSRVALPVISNYPWTILGWDDDSLVPKFSVTEGRGNKTCHSITNKLLTFDFEQNHFLTSMHTVQCRQENFVRQGTSHI